MKAYHTSNREFAKCEKYCRQQRELLRAIEDLAQQEREMYELDNRKDQIMTACKVALANLGMWVRDHYFPAEYAHARWTSSAIPPTRRTHSTSRCARNRGGVKP